MRHSTTTPELCVTAAIISLILPYGGCFQYCVFLHRVSAHMPKHNMQYTKGHIFSALFPCSCALQCLSSPQKCWEKTCKASLLLKTASSQVKQISSDWPWCWRKASHFQRLAYNMTLSVWHKVLDYVYFYNPYVIARVFTAEVFFDMLMNKGLLLRSWLLGARLLAPCNCRIDAPSRVPTPKCFCSHSIPRSETPFYKFGDLFLNQLFFLHTAALPKLSFNHTEAIDIYIY